MNRYILIFTLTILVLFTFQVKQSAGMSKEEVQLSEFVDYKFKYPYHSDQPSTISYSYITTASPCVYVKKMKNIDYELCPASDIEKEMQAIQIHSLTPEDVRIKVVLNEGAIECTHVFNIPGDSFCSSRPSGPLPFKEAFTVAEHKSPSPATANIDPQEKLRVLISDYNYSSKQRGITAYQLRSDPALYVRHNGVVKKYYQFDILEELLRESDDYTPFIAQLFISGDNLFFSYVYEVANCKINVATDTATCWKIGPGYDPFDEAYYDYDTPVMTIEKLP